MKSMFAIASLTISMALVAASPAQAAAKRQGASCQKLNPAMLEGKFAKFNSAWATKNPDTVTALFDDDAVLLATLANVPRTDHSGIRDYFVKFLKSSPVGKIDSSTIKSGCNWALQAGTWTVSLTDAKTGTKSDVKARYTFLYQFEDGKWKIEHLHSSMMPEK